MKLNLLIFIFSYLFISIETNAQKVITSVKQDYSFHTNDGNTEKIENKKRKIILTDSTFKIEMYDNIVFSGNYEKTIDEKTKEVIYIIKGGLFQILDEKVFFNLMGTKYKCFISYWTNNKAYEINEVKKSKRETEFEKEEYDKDVKLFGKFAANCLKEKKIKIGLKKDFVIVILGRPLNKNITETKYNYSEQWVYDNKYVYFKNGIVTAIQTSE
jgi:hypothetical protein